MRGCEIERLRFRRLVCSLVMLLLAALLLTPACRNRVTGGLGFGFPQGTRYDDPARRYSMNVTWSSDAPITLKGKKAVVVTISDDKTGRELLQEQFEVVSTDLDASAKWNEFDHVELELFEEGAESYADDPYNAALLKSGPRLIRTLRYEYDSSTKRFEATE